MCQQSHTPPEDTDEELIPGLAPSFWQLFGLQQHSSNLHTVLILCFHTVFPLYMGLCVQIFPFCKNIIYIRLGPIPMISSLPDHLQRSYFQMKSHSEMLDIRTSIFEFWRSTIQPTTQFMIFANFSFGIIIYSYEFKEK